VSPSIVSTLALTLVVGLAGACTTRQGDFTVISSKLVRLSDFDLSGAERIKGVEGRDVAHIIVLFPTKANPSLEDALNDALEKGGGDVMTDATVHTWYWYIPYVYGQSGWKVKGDVVRTRR
jgi:hypothetical protein